MTRPKTPQIVALELAKIRANGSRVYLVGKIMGIAVGSIFCIAGFVIAVLGLVGTIESVVQLKDFQSRLTNATPGAFFAFLGMIVLWRYKPKVSDKYIVRGDKIDHIRVE